VALAELTDDQPKRNNSTMNWTFTVEMAIISWGCSKAFFFSYGTTIEVIACLLI
jgi:hypothetical protein